MAAECNVDVAFLRETAIQDSTTHDHKRSSQWQAALGHKTYRNDPNSFTLNRLNSESERVDPRSASHGEGVALLHPAISPPSPRESGEWRSASHGQGALPAVGLVPFERPSLVILRCDGPVLGLASRSVSLRQEHRDALTIT